jgi:hypothetical protein
LRIGPLWIPVRQYGKKREKLRKNAEQRSTLVQQALATRANVSRRAG